MPAIVANMAAFLDARVNLESHLCFGSDVQISVVCAVSTAVMLMFSIIKNPPNKMK
jgi:hypothetical protein